METKRCVACAEEILEGAKLCKHCGVAQNDSRFVEQNNVLEVSSVPSLNEIEKFLHGQPTVGDLLVNEPWASKFLSPESQASKAILSMKLFDRPAGVEKFFIVSEVGIHSLSPMSFWKNEFASGRTIARETVEFIMLGTHHHTSRGGMSISSSQYLVVNVVQKPSSGAARPENPFYFALGGTNLQNMERVDYFKSAMGLLANFYSMRTDGGHSETDVGFNVTPSIGFIHFND